MSTLSDYVVRRLDAGRSGAEVCAELMAVGWSKEAAEAAYRDGLLALGIPRPDGSRDAPGVAGAGTAPKAATLDIAVNLFSFILLGIVVGALIVLCFALINRSFPEQGEQLGAYLQMATASEIHRSLASLAIAFPLYAFGMRWWITRFAAGHDCSETRLTKWLTYIVLLIAAIVIVCDLIAVVYSLLQGEMTVRFLLKVIVILGVAGIVFGFYLFERRAVQLGNAVSPDVFRGFGWGATAIVLLAAMAGYLSAGSPTTARSRAADAARANDLAALSACVDRYARAMGQLPDGLAQLERASSYDNCPTYDRETRRRYEYRIVVASRTEGAARVGEFELCATFALATSGKGLQVPGGAEKWSDHPAGRSCRVKTVPLGAEKAGQ